MSDPKKPWEAELEAAWKEGDAKPWEAELGVAESTSPPLLPEPPAEKPAPGWFEPGTQSSALVQGVGSGPTGLTDELGGAAAATGVRLSQLADYLAKTGAGRWAARKLIGGPIAQFAPDAMVDALTQTASDQAKHVVLGGDTPEKAWRNTAQAITDDEKTAIREHPKTYFAGGVIGGAGLPAANIAKGASLATKAYQFGKAGAALGALSGFGHSEADSVLGVAKDTAKGAGSGAVAGAVGGPVLSKGGELAGRLARYLAKKEAVRAVAPMAGLNDHLRAEGIDPDDLGDAVLNAGILRPLGTTRGALSRLETKMDEVGRVIGESTPLADTRAAQGLAPLMNVPRSSQAVTSALRNATKTGAHVDAADAADAAIQRQIAYQAVPGPMGRTTLGPTYQGMWGLKSNLQKTLKPKELSNMEQAMYREGVGGLTDDLYSQLRNALPPDKMAAFEQATATYGPLRVTEKLLNKAITREAARKPIGLTDLGKGQIAGQALGGFWGPLVTFGSAMIKGRLPSTMATGLEAAGRNLQGFIGGGQWSGGLPAALSTGVSRAATKPEPDDEDRAGFVKGNGG